MLRDSLSGPAGGNIEQVEITFAPDVPAARILAAWNDTTATTEVLNAGFQVTCGEPRHLVAIPGNHVIQPLADCPPCWQSWLAEDRLAPLPLAGGRPWRAAFWPSGRKLVWTFHHALLDGRSIARILRSFQVRLRGETEAPTGLQAIRRTPPSADQIARAAEFHRRAFAGLETRIPEFPLDPKGVPARVRRTLGGPLTDRLSDTAGALGVTPATLVTWAWGRAFARVSGTNSAAIGQVRSGPPHPGCAGFSMNTVPLVIPAPQTDIPAALRELRQRMLEMREIEQVSPQDLPADVFGTSDSPWPAGVLMVESGTLHHQVGFSPEIESIILHESSTSPLLASAAIFPQLDLEIEADGHGFGPDALSSLIELWVEFLDQAITENDRFELLPETMDRQLRTWESGGETMENGHLAALWNKAVRSFPQDTAIWITESPLTYSELEDRAKILAARLHEAGVTPGTAVASLLHDRIHLAPCLLALVRLGAISVPLDPALPAARHRAIVADSQARLVIADGACPPLELPCLDFHGESRAQPPAHIPTDPSQVLALLYTSGSTGVPKGVMMHHEGVTNEALAIARLAGIKRGDRLLQFASPGFDASLEELLAALLSGATLVPRPEEIATDLALFHRFLHTAEITVLDLTTAFWAAWCAWMVAQNETIPPKVRIAVIGGERLSAAAARDWTQAGGASRQLINTYGPTEASIVATYSTIPSGWTAAEDPPIGKPLPGVLARIADSAGRRLPPGAAGELWLGGPCLSPGYWQKPDKTADSFPVLEDGRWYRTGDRAHWDEHGCLRFLGRQDDQLKIRGHRVEPAEVIRILESYPGVAAVHVGPLTETDTTRLAAWVRWTSPPAHGWPAALSAHTATRLAAAAVPSRWAAVDEFPLTERGKLDRRALPHPTLTAAESTAFEAPATATEIQLASFFSGLLGIAEISRHDSFFELGGHSLAALQLFASISNHWHIRIPMATLIQAPTPRLLGSVVDRETAAARQGGVPRSVVIPVRAEGHLAPLFCIHGGDGGVIFYRDLAKHLPAGRPLLAIEAPALGADEEVRVIPVEESAAHYIRALREHQPRGPFHLAGYSYGGLLVYEMASQLIAAGESVAFAGLFDTVNPAAPTREYSLLERAEVFWNAERDSHLLSRVSRMLVRIREGIATNRRVKQEIHAARTAGSTQPHSGIRALQVREAHWQSMTIYQPPAIDCHITLFKTQSADDKFELPHDYGWSRLVKTLEIIEVPGQHLTMFAPRHVGALARHVARRL